MWRRGASSIHYDAHGFGKYATLNIIQHLYATYGRVGPDEIHQNQDNMHKTIYPHRPITLLFKKIEDAQKFATTANTPFTQTVSQWAHVDALLTWFLIYSYDINRIIASTPYPRRPGEVDGFCDRRARTRVRAYARARTGSLMGSQVH